MAQVVKLKRTAVSGKVPSTSNIELGELAINTYDGRIFFEKDSGTPSIEQVVTTNSTTTGSINIIGSVTASYFIGDGSNLTFGGTGLISGSSQLDGITLGATSEIEASGSFSGSFVGNSQGPINGFESIDVSSYTLDDTVTYDLDGVAQRGTLSGLKERPTNTFSGGSTSYYTTHTLTFSANISSVLKKGDIITYTPSRNSTATASHTIIDVGTTTAVINRPGDTGGTGFAIYTPNNLNTFTINRPITYVTDNIVIESDIQFNSGSNFSGNSYFDGGVWITGDYANIAPTKLLLDADEIVSTDTPDWNFSIVPKYGYAPGGTPLANSYNLNYVSLGSSTKAIRYAWINELSVGTISVPSGSGTPGNVSIGNNLSVAGNVIGSSTSTGSFGRVEVNANTIAIGGVEINSTVASNIQNTSGTNTGDVTLDGSYDYLTLSGQEITLGQVDASTDISNLNTAVVSSLSNQDVDLGTGDLTATDISAVNLTLSGDLTVSGTTTTVNSTTVNIGDNILELNYGGSSTTGGIYVKDGTGASTTSGSLLWDATNDYWKLGKLGSESEVITISNIITNLPSGVISGSSQIQGDFLQVNGDSVLSGSGTTNHIAFYNSENGLTSHDYLKVNPNFNLFLYDSVSYSDAIRIQMTGSLSILGGISAIEQNSTFSNAYFEDIQANYVFAQTGSFNRVVSSGVVIDDGNMTITGIYTGDGSGLTNISTDIGEVATVTSSFDNLSTINVGHNFNSKNVIVSVYDNNDNQIIPQTVSLTDQDTVQVVLSSAQSGFVVVAKGGHVVSGSADDASNLNGQPASYYLDYDNFTNIPSGILSSSNETFTEFSQSVASDFAGLSTDYNDLQNIPSGIISSSLQLANTSVSNESLNTFTASAVTVSGNGTSGSLSVFSDTHTIVNSPITSVTSETIITHNNNGNTVFTVSGSNGELLSVDDDNTGNVFTVNDISGVPIFQVNNAITASTHFVPSQNVTYDLGSSTFRWRDLYLSGSTIDLGGTLLQRDTDGNVEFKDSQTDALKTLKIKELEIGEGANKVKLKLDDNNKVKFEDSTSGDYKLEATFYKETVSSSSKHTITHNLNEDYPIVQVYDLNKQQVIPESITSVTSNVVELEFTSNFSGVIVIKV